MKQKLFVVLIAVAVVTGCTRVGPGYVGIKVNMAGSNKGVQEYPARTGWVFYNPVTEDVFEYPTFVQNAVWTHDVAEGKPVNEELTFTNADQMLIAVDLSLAYTILPDRVPSFYVKFRNDNLELFTHGYLRNQARERVNEIAGRYKIEQIMGDNAEFLNTVRGALQKDLDPIGVKLEQFGIIGAPRPPKQVIESINLKIQATQIATQKQNELVQVQADAAKLVAQAEGAAKATLIAADADAAYNRKINESLTPTLVEWQKAQKWDGKLPQVTGGGGVLLNLTK